MLGKEGHVLPGGPSAGKAGGGLDILRAGGGDDLAQFDLLLVGEQARLNNHLEQAAPAGFLHGLDLPEEVIPPPVLHPADVDDHVDLVRPVVHSVPGLKALGGGGAVAVGEADDRAHGQLVPHVLPGLPDIAGGDADGGGGVLDSVVAHAPDLLPRRPLGQQGVVHRGQNFAQLHIVPLVSPRKRHIFVYM